MLDDWTSPALAETILLSSGAALLVAGAIRITAQRRWRSLLTLPAVGPLPIRPIDPVMALAAMWLLPHLALAVLGGESAATTQPASAPAAVDELPDAARIMAVGVGQLAAATALILLGATRFRGNLRAWGLSMVDLPRRIGQALLAYIAIWPICFGLLHLTVFLMRLADPEFAPREHQTIRTLLSSEHAPGLIAVVAMNAVLLAPLIEELFFRGLFQPVLAMAARGPWAAVLFAAAAFGLFHFPLVHTMPALAAFGLWLGYLYARTGSLTLVVLLHVIFNGKTLLWLAWSIASGDVPAQ